MTKYQQLFFVLSFLLFNGLVGQEPHHTTAYLPQSGTMDLLFTYSKYQSDHFWNKHYQQLPAFNHFDRQSLLFYTEYALNSYNSLTLHGGYSLVNETLNGKSYGLHDMELSWKHLLYQGQTSALTLQLIEIFPIKDQKSSIRYSQPGLQANVLYSHVFCLGNGGWYDIALGYRHYQGFPSSRILAETALGYRIFSFMHLISSFQLDYGLSNGKSTANLNNMVCHPNYRLGSAQVECVIRLFSHGWLSLGAFKHVWGMNIGTGGGLFGGTWFDF